MVVLRYTLVVVCVIVVGWGGYSLLNPESAKVGPTPEERDAKGKDQKEAKDEQQAEVARSKEELESEDNPEKLFAVMMDALKGEDFSAFYECFSTEGKQAFGEGEILTDTEIRDLELNWKQAGFSNVSLESYVFDEANKVITGSLRSVRSGKVKIEEIALGFVKEEGDWKASSFSIKPK